MKKEERQNGLSASEIQTLTGKNCCGDHQTNRFVGPVVLHEDVLSSVLSSISEQHYNFIAVGPRDICLLKKCIQT